MTNTSHSAEQVREEMRRLRSQMDADVECFVENTRVLLDWHSYYRSAPWLCLGAAAVVGYLVVPSKTRLVTIGGEQLAELARNRQVTFSGQPGPPQESLGSALLKMAVGALWRTALGVGTAQLNQILSQRPPQSPPQSPSKAPSTGGS
jgi:hypothetical protein